MTTEPSMETMVKRLEDAIASMTKEELVVEMARLTISLRHKPELYEAMFRMMTLKLVLKVKP